MQLKSTIVIKNVNEDVVFALDLADSEDRYYKFEGVSSAFLKLINAHTSEEKIIEEILKTYEDCTPEQIKKDLESLRLKLQSLNFLLE
jgi:hypothetical protein